MSGRNDLVNRHRDLNRIVENYRNLYDASRSARYEAETYNDYPEEVDELLEKDLASIVARVSQLIGDC